MSGTIVADISDHFINFMFVRKTKSTKANNDKISRQFSYQ